MRWLWLLVIPVSTFAQESLKVKPAYGSLSSESGRYIFGQVSEIRSDQYVLDTKTGRMWQKTAQKGKDGETLFYVFEPLYYEEPKSKNLTLEPK